MDIFMDTPTVNSIISQYIECITRRAFPRGPQGFPGVQARAQWVLGSPYLDQQGLVTRRRSRPRERLYGGELMGWHHGSLVMSPWVTSPKN